MRGRRRRPTRYNLPLLEEALDARGMTPDELAAEVSIPVDVVYEALDGNLDGKGLPAPTCHRICAVLNTTVLGVGGRSGRGSLDEANPS